MKKYAISAILLSNLFSAQSISLVKDINQGAYASSPNYFTEYDGRLYFSASTAEYGTEIWSTDGTTEGTSMVQDVIAGTSSFLPSLMVSYNGKLYISNLLNDTTHPLGLYSYNGNTVQLVSKVIQWPGNMVVGNGNLYIRKDSDLYLMNTDEVIKNVGEGVPISSHMAPINGSLVVAGNQNPSGNSYQLYRYSDEGMKLLKVINNELTANPQNFYYSSAVNKVFFSAGASETGFELWTTDGTEEGTLLIKDINAGSSSSFPADFVQVGSKVFFTANDGVNGKELWVTDGTEEGTTLVKDIMSGSTGSSPYDLTALNDKVYFFASDGSEEAKLWESDGTEAGTKVTLELRPGYKNFTIGKMAAYNGALYVSAKLYVNLGQELYKIDTGVLATDQIAGSETAVEVYPNPSSGVLYVKGAAKGNIKLYDFSGKLIKNEEFTEGKAIRLNIAPGVYQSVVSSPKGVSVTKKIIVK